MNLPTWWRRASFSVAEAAEICAVTEHTIRTWLARNISNDFNGAKTDGRLWLSGQDCFYYALLRELTAYGCPVRTSMRIAEQIADETDESEPLNEYLIVRTTLGVSNFELADEVDTSRPAVVIPLRRLFEVHLERCAAAYTTEAR